jgi:hypothetical protein
VEPPLSELLALLRDEGVAIPEEVLTLDEAFEVLQKVRMADTFSNTSTCMS